MTTTTTARNADAITMSDAEGTKQLRGLYGQLTALLKGAAPMDKVASVVAGHPVYKGNKPEPDAWAAYSHALLADIRKLATTCPGASINVTGKDGTIRQYGPARIADAFAGGDAFILSGSC